MKQDARMLPQPSHEAAETEIWRRYARELEELLQHQNETLYQVAHSDGVVLAALVRWSEWRKKQCDFDETMSQEELELFKLLPPICRGA